MKEMRTSPPGSQNVTSSQIAVCFLLLAAKFKLSKKSSSTECFSFSHLCAAVAGAVVPSARLFVPLLVAVLLHASLRVHLSAVSISDIFFFDLQADVFLLFHCNRQFHTKN